MTIPPLSTEDLEHAASIVHRVYSHTNPDDQQLAQRQLFELQQRIEAWNLVLPFLQHDEPNLQFIGAHTAQVKIARDWDTLPKDEFEAFRQSFLGIVGYAAANGRSKTVMRKLYVALVSLALRLSTTSPPQWPDWVVSSLRDLSDLGLSSENLLDYLAIVVEEAHRSDLTGPARVHLSTSVRNAAPVVCQAAGTALSDPTRSMLEKLAALRCLEAWSQQLPGEQLAQIIPVLLTSLSHPDLFVAASDVISEFMTSSALGGGAGTRILTEPLLSWVGVEGKDIFQSSFDTETIDDISRGLCKMLVAVGDHSLDYMITHIHSPSVLAYLEILLGFTGFPGWYGVDEFESDMTISFWVYFGEAVLDSNWNGDEDNSMMQTARSILLQLVRVLQKKCTWPPQEELQTWTKEGNVYSVRPKVFTERLHLHFVFVLSYRRDVGESMLNAYYVLRDETLQILVEVVLAGLNSPDLQTVNWEEVESSLHCIDCCQDGVPLQKNTYIEQLIEALTGIPTTGHLRLRQTTINLIGDYSTWFTDQPTPLLLSALTFVVTGLQEPALSLQAAGALKQLCDANRTKLAPHIVSFGEIHSSAAKISKNADRAKVIESIASVVEALSPVEGVAPTLAIVHPIVRDWGAALQGTTQYPEEARLLVEQQLRLLSSCAKGLSPAQDTFTYADPDTPEGAQRTADMNIARSDSALAEARHNIVGLLRETMSYWSIDPELSDATSDLIRSITSLPLEATLISLPPAPLLELVCLAADRQLTAVWLALVSRLVVQLEPPSFISLKTEPGGDTRQLVDQAARSIVVSSMRVLQVPGVMEENPDLVQAFFSCVESITHTFMRSIIVLPPELSNSLMECATRAVSLQERYSLVAGCKFLVTFIKRSASDDASNDAAQHLLAAHAQHITDAIVNGIAGDAPRSAVPNLAAVLSALVSKFPAETRVWLQHSMQNPRLAENPRVTHEAKETFLKTINASRSSQRTVTASNEFALIARGLSGTSYAAGQVL